MAHCVIDVLYGPGNVTLDDSALYGMSFVAGSAATGFVVWLCKTGGTPNELRNLREHLHPQERHFKHQGRVKGAIRQATGDERQLVQLAACLDQYCRNRNRYCRNSNCDRCFQRQGLSACPHSGTGSSIATLTSARRSVWRSIQVGMCLNKVQSGLSGQFHVGDQPIW